MARAIWSGSISFGMVSIPVKLYGATESKDIRFHLLHAKDGTRLKQIRWCPTDEAEVPWNETARGYEYAKGQYVVLKDEDFEQLPLPSRHTIDISAFVEETEIDPVFFEKSYFVAPTRDTGGDRSYLLLLRAMQTSGMVGIGRFVLRTKPHLVAIRPLEHVLGLETLYFGDEVRKAEDVARLPAVALSDRELKMAEQLVKALATEWIPDKHADQYREELLELLRSKRPWPRGEDPEAAGSGTAVDDLMATLKASVEAAKRKNGGSAKTRRRVGDHRTG
jgi:DNA end-binding protein Ku